MHTYDFYLNERQMQNFYIKLVNVGFEAIAPNDSHGRDQRDYYLLQFVSRGRGTLICRSKQFSLGRHDIFIIPPGMEYAHYADSSEPYVLYWIGFRCKNPDVIDVIFEHIFYDEENPVMHSTVGIEDEVTAIYYEARKRSPNFLLIETKIFSIFSKIAAKYHSSSQLVYTSYFKKADDYISENLHEKITVKQLAEESCAIDVSELYRVFKKRTGMSPLRYIREKKIEKACELIQQTDMSYHDIARALGYEYDSLFYKVFRQIKGMTPSEFRSKSYVDVPCSE